VYESVQINVRVCVVYGGSFISIMGLPLVTFPACTQDGGYEYTLYTHDGGYEDTPSTIRVRPLHA